MDENNNSVEILHINAERMAEMLDATQWAQQFEWQEMMALTKHMCVYEIQKDVLLFNEGETNQYMGIIVEGRVEIYKSDYEHGDSRIAVLNKSQSLGEMGLLDNGPRSAHAKAATDVVLLVIHEADINQLLEENPKLAFKFIRHIGRMLSQRLRRTSGQLVDFLH